MANEQQAYMLFGAAGVMTGTNLLTGPWMNIFKSPYCSFIAKWTGTPTGTFTFDVSNDDDPNLAQSNALNGAPMGAMPLTLPAGFAAGNPAGAAGTFGFEFSPLPYKWVRIKYLNSGSAGQLTVAFDSKGAA